MSKSENHNNTIVKITLNLTLACFFCGVIIALVYFITAPVSAKNAIMIKEESMRTLVEDAEKFKAIEGKNDMYEAIKDGKTIAYVIQSESKGYGGKIEILVGVGTQSRVIGYKILSHNETPGLGDKTLESPFKDQFKGKDLKHLVVTKDSSNKDDIQAITGATISSKAVTKGIEDAVKEVNEYLGGK